MHRTQSAEDAATILKSLSIRFLQHRYSTLYYGFWQSQKYYVIEVSKPLAVERRYFGVFVIYRGFGD
jgi:hypothetical protein